MISQRIFPGKSNCRQAGATGMNRRLFILLLTLFIWGFPALSEGQCVPFARGVVKPELAPFLHDGNLNATILGEGEKIILKKTVFDGITYRLIVMGVPDLPPLRFKLKDKGGRVLFDNKNHNFAPKWDFDVQTTQNILVDVQVTADDDQHTNTGGCVAILFGIKRD